MKTMKMTFAAVAMFITTMTMQAQPMSYYAMRENARFLTDRMAYTLGIATSLLDDLYMINYDYICGVNDYLDDVAYGYHYDDYMAVLYARDASLRRLLSPYQWSRLMTYDYFYRPISFVNRRWSFSIYAYDPYRTHFYYHVPHRYDHYRGGHFFRGMAPAGGHIGPHGGGGPGYHIGGGQPNRPQHGYDSRYDNRGNMGGDHAGQPNGGNNHGAGGGGMNGSNDNRNVGTGGAVRHVGTTSQGLESRPSSTRQVGGNTGVEMRGATRQVSAPTQGATRSAVRQNAMPSQSATRSAVRQSAAPSQSATRSTGASRGSAAATRSTSGGGGTRGGGRR